MSFHLYILTWAFMNGVLADIPVHCPRSKLVGTWDIKMTKLNPDGLVPKFPEEMGKPFCMLPAPNTVEANLKLDSLGDWAEILGADQTMTMELTESVHLSADKYTSHHMVAHADDVHGSSNGVWTTVYDEGFEVTMPSTDLSKEEISFFAFSKYRAAKENELARQSAPGACDEKNGCHKGYISDCDRTFIGWYRRESADGRGYGCWFGTRRPETELQQETQSVIRVASDHNPGRPLQATQQQASVVRAHSALPSDVVQVQIADDGTVRDHDGTHSGETSDRSIKDSDSRPVSEIKEATVGANGEMEASKSDDSSVFESPPARRRCNLDRNTEARTLFAKLPTSHDWVKQFGNGKKLLGTQIPNQGDCGSCFAVSSLSALQMRIRVKLKSLGVEAIDADSDLVHLSVDSALSCGYYNQACEGGFESLVYRQAHEFGIADSSCMPYTAGSGNPDLCRSSCFTDPSKVWFTSSYGFVGGSEGGGCSETQMMAEIQDQGPISAGIRVSRAVTAYHEDKLALELGEGKQAIELRTKAAAWTHHQHAIHHQTHGPSEVVHLASNAFGCDDFNQTAVEGKFVLVWHGGGCAPSEKAFALEKAGARGVLIGLSYDGDKLYTLNGEGPSLPTFALLKDEAENLVNHISGRKVLLHGAIRGWPILEGEDVTESPEALEDALHVTFEAPKEVHRTLQQQLDNPFSPLWKSELGHFLSSHQNPKEGGLVVNGSKVDALGDWEIFRAKLKHEIAHLVPGTDEDSVNVLNATTVGFRAWEYIEHAITIVGWGEDHRGEPYWIVMNSWGHSWGNHGFFYVRRGNNDLGIEGDVVWARPDICRGQLKHTLLGKGGPEGKKLVEESCGVESVAAKREIFDALETGKFHRSRATRVTVFGAAAAALSTLVGL